MRTLIADDDVEERQYMADVVRSWGYEVLEAGDGEEALSLIHSRKISVLITDVQMPGVDGLELLRQLRNEELSPVPIVMTAYGSVEKALKAIHGLGGFWFLEKPVDLAALKVLMERAVEKHRLAAENMELKRQLSFQGILGDMVGVSPAMRSVFALLRQVAPTNAAVLVTGESGTGKELVARAIHENSKRATAPFVAVNCAALPETLIESELFGHEKGSFTGAYERRIGAIEAAEGGTLFLDELGEMPMPMQAKLLRVLEDLRFKRLGSQKEIQASVRIIAATNREPEQAIADGKLREDLYYRLNVIRIHLPPLRERREDVAPIVRHMIPLLNQKYGTDVQRASQEFLDLMTAQTWKGNVRELRNTVERAMIVAGSGILRPEHASVGGDFLPSSPVPITPPPTASPVAMPAAATPEPLLGGLPITVGMTVSDAEKVLIQATLEHTNNNKVRAAGILGISRKTLHAKCKQYALDDGAETDQEMAAEATSDL